MALRYCHVSMMCKINKSEIPGGPLSFFDALFGRCTAFYGHFLIDAVTSEGSTHISLSYVTEKSWVFLFNVGSGFYLRLSGQQWTWADTGCFKYVWQPVFNRVLCHLTILGLFVQCWLESLLTTCWTTMNRGRHRLFEICVVVCF